MSVAADATQENHHFESKLINKVTSYPLVTSVWDGAKGYYTAAKEMSPIVKYASETIETNVEKGVKWVAPTVEPLIHKAEPLLVKVDEFGCNQLDKIEKVTERITETYSSSKQMIEQRVSTITNDLKATTAAVVEVSKHTLEDKIVPPVDNYLKTSVLAVPLNLTLDITEKVCDRILPVEETKASSTEITTTEPVGPVVRAGQLSVRIQREAFKKLTNLTLRTPEARDAMKFSVDLIQYAATQIDNGAHVANRYVRQTVAHTKSSVSQRVESSKARVKAVVVTQRQNYRDTRQKVQVLTEDALHAIQHAIDVLSKQVQPGQTTVSLDTLKERTTKIFAQLESTKQWKAFALIAKSSVTKLNELSVKLAEVSEPLLQTQLVQSVTASLRGIMENFLSFGKLQKTLRDRSGSVSSSSDEDVDVTDKFSESDE